MRSLLIFVLVILLLGALLPMPYYYFEFLRTSSFFIFSYLVYASIKEKQESFVWVFSMLALLFQPFLKIYFNRVIWNIIDVIVAVYLVYYLLGFRKRK
jgi:predicted membrane protein